jgi:hypothetical protein
VVVRDRTRRTLKLFQKEHIRNMLKNFGMDDCKTVCTPMEKEPARIEGKPDVTYMSMVGSLLYISVMTRPDITFAVQALGRHMQASSEEHIVAAKRVMRYLKGTVDMGIVYSGRCSDTRTIKGYCDSTWASDASTKRSVTGYVYTLAGGAISWNSKLQPTVALSSTEAEYMAAAAATQDAIYLREFLASLHFVQDGPTIIYEDNQGAIALSENPVHHKRVKHIDIRHHFVRERVESGDVKLIYIETNKQIADILTKPLERVKFEFLRARLMGHL